MQLVGGERGGAILVSDSRVLAGETHAAAQYWGKENEDGSSIEVVCAQAWCPGCCCFLSLSLPLISHLPCTAVFPSLWPPGSTRVRRLAPAGGGSDPCRHPDACLGLDGAWGGEGGGSGMIGKMRLGMLQWST